jgi:hypothetical protein
MIEARLEEQPLLVSPMKCSYVEILQLLNRVDFSAGTQSANNEKVLSPELAQRILQYLTIKRVNQGQVRVLECSSHDRGHPLVCCLSPDEETWWMSANRTMPLGRGQQWVQFALSPTLCRLSAVLLKIPPLPQGPLSVREFFLQAFSIDRGWHSISPIFVVENRVGWQRFPLLDPADVDEVRVVCVSNQMSAFVQQQQQQPQNIDNVNNNNNDDAHDGTGLAAAMRRFESVGYFAIRFE